MTAPRSLLSQPASDLALPGTWKLRAGRAITLEPREQGVLRVAHGGMWVTFDGPHAGPRNDLGDHFVAAGGALRVAPGQRLVIESLSSPLLQRCVITDVPLDADFLDWTVRVILAATTRTASFPKE